MAASGLIGGTAGFVGSVVGQVTGNLIAGKSLEESLSINFNGVAVATAVGATAGFLAPVTAVTMAGAVITNAVAGGVQYVASQVVNDRQINALDLGVSVTLGAVAGRVIGPLKSANPLPPDRASPWLSRWADEARQIVSEDLTKAAVALPALGRSGVAGATSNAPATQIIERVKQQSHSSVTPGKPAVAQLPLRRQVRGVRWQ